jgi:two-component system, sensor histidine kinase
MARRALIVEDEPLIAIDLEATPRTLGLDGCRLASNPREAIERATSIQADFVLMGVYFDERCQGLKATKWLREACQIPVLLVTAHNDGDMIARIRELAPGAPLCAKPVRDEHLAEALTEATKGARGGVRQQAQLFSSS